MTGPEGDPLAGATVTISHEAGYIKTESTLTGPDGRAEFPVLRPGGGYAIDVTSGSGPIVVGTHSPLPSGTVFFSGEPERTVIYSAGESDLFVARYRR